MLYSLMRVIFKSISVGWPSIIGLSSKEKSLLRKRLDQRLAVVAAMASLCIARLMPRWYCDLIDIQKIKNGEYILWIFAFLRQYNKNNMLI